MDVWSRILAGGAAGELDAPVLTALRNCPQSRGHHDEGDVLTHTSMVLAEVEKVRGTGPDASLVRLAALLHDVGKPDTTLQVSPGRYRSTNHEHVGAGTVRELVGTSPLKNLTLQERWALPLLVDTHMWHHHPGTITRREVHNVSDHVSLDDLTLLWEADTRGRICDDPLHLGEQVEYGTLVLQDLGYGTRGAYEELLTPSEWENLPGHVRRHASASLRSGIETGEAQALLAREERRPRRSTLTYMVGLPGSGKSTWSTKNLPDGGVLITSEGDRRRDRRDARIQAMNDLEEALRAGRDVIVDATHLRRETRRLLVAAADRHQAALRAVVLDAPLETALTRQGTRPWQAAVPREAIVKMCRMTDPLGRDEYDTLEVVTP